MKQSFKLFKNRYKEGGQPDWKMPKDGQITIEGKQYEVAAWTNTDKNGNEYFGCEIQEAYVKQRPDAEPEQKAEETANLKDIPF